jgi:hypothetical protein
MSNRKQLSFTNKFGDIINPGDNVYVVTTCSHRTHVEKGEYVGYVERHGYDYREKKSVIVPAVQVKKPYTRTIYWDKRTDKEFDWKNYTTREDFQENVETRKQQAFRVSTLQYNRILPASVSADRLMEVV